MAFDHVKKINDAIEASGLISLGSTYELLDYVFDVSKNSLKGNKKRFGVYPSIGSSITGVTRAMTLNQRFHLILTDSFVNKHDDKAQRETTLALYEKALKLYRDLFLTKVGLPDIVMLINDLSIEETNFDINENVAVLNAQINIQYRLLLD